MVAFRGVIVNDVENHFDAGGVKVAHHAFELGHLPAERAAAGVLRFRREESRSCCNPNNSSGRDRPAPCRRCDACTGSSSTAVTPRSFKYLIARGAADAGVSASQFLRNFGISLVNPFTCTS